MQWTSILGSIGNLVGGRDPGVGYPSPFHLLSDVPRWLHCFSNGSRYLMPSSVAASWEQLDQELSFVTHLLQLHYGAPALRPMNPRGFGFSKSRSHPNAVMRSIYKSRDWFCVWIALLSYLIACAETVESDLEPYPSLAKKHWATYLLEQGVEWTFLDALLTSFAFCFSPKVMRSGVFLHMPPKDGSQPSVEWFCSYDIPVWYPWGEEQAKNPNFSKLAPPTHLLQLGTTTISKSPTSDSSERKEAAHVPKDENHQEVASCAPETKSTPPENLTRIRGMPPMHQWTSTISPTKLIGSTLLLARLHAEFSISKLLYTYQDNLHIFVIWISIKRWLISIPVSLLRSCIPSTCQGTQRPPDRRAYSKQGRSVSMVRPRHRKFCWRLHDPPCHLAHLWRHCSRPPILLRRPHIYFRLNTPPCQPCLLALHVANVPLCLILADNGCNYDLLRASYSAQIFVFSR